MSTVATDAPADRHTATRLTEKVGSRHQMSGPGFMMLFALLGAAGWYLWLAVRGFWTHGQETTVSVIQLGIVAFAIALLAGQSTFSAWALWASAAVLLAIAGGAARVLLADPRHWIVPAAAIAGSAVCLHYLWSRRMDFGHTVKIEPFQLSDPAAPGLMEIVTGAARRENVTIALNNAIAEAGSVAALGDTALDDVAVASGLKLEGELADECAWIYRSYLAHFVKNGEMGSRGAGELARLATLLRLKEPVVKEAHDGIGGELYRARVQTVLGDYRVEQDERDALDALQASLGLSDGAAGEIRKEEGRAAGAVVVQRVTRDGQLSNEERQQLDELQERMGIDLRADQRTREVLDRARAVWEVMNDVLPVVDTGVRLEAGEVCHAVREAAWHDWRQVDHGTTYTTRSSVRHGEGFFGPADRVETKVTATPDVRTEMRAIDSGRLLVTNRGLRWIGASRNHTWPWPQLLDVSRDGDMLTVHPGSGDNVRFAVSGDVELFAMVIGRGLREG